MVIVIVFDALCVPVAFRAEAKKLNRLHYMHKSAKNLQKSAKKPKFLFSPTFFFRKTNFFPVMSSKT